MRHQIFDGKTLSADGGDRLDMNPLIISTVLLLALQAFAQQASSSWRKPNVTVSRSDRISLADAALQEAIAFLDTTNGLFPDPGDSYGLAGTLYSQLAEFDLASNQTKYATAVQQYFGLASESVESLGTVNFTGEFMNDGVNYGHAAVIAYTTYQNPIFLEYAKQVWWAVQTYTISQKELDVGTTPLKNFTLEPTCEGITMAGGTFREKSFTSPNINVEATGSFLVLSALLAEATNDTLYLNAAKASADFIRAHLYSVQNLVQDTISGRAIDSCALSEETVAGSYNSGLFIEGLAILYSITQNASIHDMIAQTVTAAIGYPGWQGSNGIIANGAAKQSDMLFPRGLATVNARNASTPALRSYIDAYLSVQFNAVIDLATTTGTNIYALDWNGPPSSSFKPANQTNAIQVLVNAINLNQPAPTSNPTSSSSGSATSPPPSSTSSPPSPPVIHKSSKVGPIVGGVIGGLVLLLGILVGLFLWHRRSRNRASSSAGRTAIAPAINPYDLRFNEMPSLPPRSTEFYDPGGPSSLTQGSTSQTGITSTTSSGPPMGEVPVGGLRYPSMNVNEVAEDDEPPDYPATEISRSRRRTGK